MGKSRGTALGIVALLLSLGFGGYFVVDKFVLTPAAPPATNQYFDDGPAFYIPSGEAWLSDSYVKIEFDIAEGQTVYFSFEALVLFDDSSVPNTYIEFRFKVDGIIWSYPYRRVWRYNVVNPFGIRFSVAMQHYNTTMSVGAHSVSVIAKGDHTVDIINDWSLFVQTFN